MSLRIVTHCYAEKLKQYAIDLRYQLSSLIIYKPNFPVSVSICCSRYDDLTMGVLREFAGELDLDIHFMDLPSLFRRSIGRNQVALESSEDLVWFADADYVFKEGCLDQLWSIWNAFEGEKPIMVYPKHVQFHETHAHGDALIEESEGKTGILDLDTTHFVTTSYSRAIGGVQITDGWFAKRHGYLNESKKYQRPLDREHGRPFHTTEDSAFRRHCSLYGKIVPIELNNLYRIRHYLNAYQDREKV